MGTLVRALAALSVAVVVAACSGFGPRFLTYEGPEVTHVVVHKAARQLELWHHDVLLRSYRVQLGRNPIGHKQERGDGRTPEGLYMIDRRNLFSAYHLSLGIDYPRPADIEAARARGVDPGGDIFLHGRGPKHRFARGDWTDGCIAVRDREIEEIYAMVRDGTPVLILP